MFPGKMITTMLLALSLGAQGQAARVWEATVLAGESGEPLGGVAFHDADGEIIATSAADGRVVFASQAGVRLELTGSARLAAHLDLEGQPRDLGVVTLEPSAVLLGTLLAPDGQPAAGQRIWLASPSTDPPRYRDAEYAGHLYRLGATTDEDGLFRFEGFWTRVGGSVVLIGEGGQVLRRFDATPRETTDIGDVQLVAPITVRGQVLDADGQPGAGARVALSPLQGWTYLEEDPERLLWRVATADSTGRYEIDLAAGVYQAVAIGKGKGEIPGVEFRAGQLDATATLIRLGPTRTIGGRVVDLSGRAVAGETVTATLPDPHTALGHRAAAVTDEAGCWRIEDMPAHGVYVEIGGRQRPDFIVDAAEADSPSCAQARTMVVDTAPTGRVRVVVDACSERPGRCEITHQALEPSRPIASAGGGWRVLGVPDGWDLAAGAWAIRAKVAGYVTEERTIVVAAGQEQEVRFDLERQANVGTVRVRVLGPAGQPAGMTAVRLASVESQPRFYIDPTLTGADGVAVFPVMSAGRYRASARRLGSSETAARDVEVPPGDSGIELRLAAKEHSAQVHGTVLDSDGVPVGGAAVFAKGVGGRVPDSATVSDSGGGFRMEVRPGKYEISAYADHAGLALLADPIVLGEKERVESTLILQRGAGVDGEIAIDGERDAETRIDGPLEWRTFYLPTWTTRNGTYHVRGLPPGSWTFTVSGSSSDTDATFVVEVNDDQTATAPMPSLDSGPYFNVSGRVLMHGVPLADAVVFDSSFDGGGSGRTDADGQFSLRARQGETEIFVKLVAPFRHAIEALDGDVETEITAHGAHVGGRVLDKVTGAPLRTAEIHIWRDELIGWTHSYRDFYHVDGLGRFEIGTLPAGRWTLRIDAEGYTREVVELEVRDDPFDLLIEHEPTGGLHLRVLDPNGESVSTRGLAIQRSQEDARLFNSYGDTTHDLWWPTAPTGPALLTVASSRGLFFSGEIDNTGAPLDIVLRPGGRLEVGIPSEKLLPYASRPRRQSGDWQAQLIGSDGLAVPALDYSDMTTRFRLRHGDAMIRVGAIAPGEYLLVVNGPGGFEWSTRVAIRAGEQARVQVPLR